MNTELPGYCNKDIPVLRVLSHTITEVTEVPGKGMGILKNFQTFRVQVRKPYRTLRISGHCATGVHNSQKFRAGTKRAEIVPRVLWHGRTKHPKVLDRGMNVVLNFQKFRVRL